MKDDYWKEKERCPHYEFTPNPTKPNSGFTGCKHPSPNIGTSMYISKHTKNKHCIHGDIKTESSEHTCRIITSLMRTGSAQSTLKEFFE